MKELSTDHETARKQVWLREKELAFDDIEATNPSPQDCNRMACEIADRALADFDKAFPREEYSSVDDSNNKNIEKKLTALSAMVNNNRFL